MERRSKERGVKRGEKKRQVFIMLLMVLMTFFVGTAAAQANDITLSAFETPHTEHGATQLPAEVGKPVQWVKQVSVQNLYDQAVSELTVSVPEDAQNIVATGIEDNLPVALTAEDNEITITDSLEFNEKKSYVIKYETEAPEKTETQLVRQGETLVKSVIVSSDYHYEDVLTYTDIPETKISEAQQKIRLYWQINGVKTDVSNDPALERQFYDTNNNGMYDRMSWITPHLSTQIFEVVIFSDANPGVQTNINLDLMYPADGQYITSTSQIGFNYSVSYNSSTTVYCNLTIDGVVKRANVPTVTDTEITTYFNLTSSSHTWFVNCAGSDGAANTSATRTFTIDLDQPTVTLLTPDYHVSYSNFIYLNFTPTDEKYPVLFCSLSVNGAINRSSLIVANNSQENVLLTGLANGVYDWNVSCKDAANNIGSSEERVFYISTGIPSEYNVSPNKDTYAIGEVGYLIINAKAGSNLTLFVETPLHDSFFRYYNGRTFPLIDTINFTDNSGMYNIDGIFTDGADMYIVKTSFTATSSFTSHIDTNETTGEPGDSFHFESNATGGIGGVTYDWDFGDDTVGNGSEVDHTYTEVGEYTVELTATDSKSNKATDTQKININRLYDVQVIVKELQTRRLLADVPVEVDDERKSTDADGTVNFTVYEGKRRIYVAKDGYEWVKQVRNITEDITITIELNNTAITNYTPPDETTEDTLAKEEDAKTTAENLLAELTTASETLESNDEATKSVITALKIEENLQQAIKELRQIIRDLANIDTSSKLTSEERQERIGNITQKLTGFKSIITAAAVEDTTEFVDYPKATDIAMLSTEYLKYKNIEYSKSEKDDYVEENIKLQAEITITTRLSIVELTRLSGTTSMAAVVTNKITKKPANTADKALLEYIPKEVAQSTSEITKLDAFDTVKSDPILKFSPDVESYSYYVEKETTLDDLQKTKHVILAEPVAAKKKGLGGITGLSILPKINIENPKLAIEIAVIILLLLAYLVYHFELIDKIQERRKEKAQYTPDTSSYSPESTFDRLTRKAKEMVSREEEMLSGELAHIRSLIASAHSHAESNNHNKAEETYKHITQAYKLLSQDAKEQVHLQTSHVYNKILLGKANNMLDEAFMHLQEGDHGKAASHYSEIKNIYTQLEKEHRAAVSDKCLKLHEKLFETSLK